MPEDLPLSNQCNYFTEHISSNLDYFLHRVNTIIILKILRVLIYSTLILNIYYFNLNHFLNVFFYLFILRSIEPLCNPILEKVRILLSVCDNIKCSAIPSLIQTQLRMFYDSKYREIDTRNASSTGSKC